MPEILRKNSSNIFTINSSVVIQLQADEKDANWIRWTHASVNKHFEDRKGIYDLYLEGDERTLQEKAEFAELRLDGPFITQPHKDYYILNIEINVLIQTHMDSKKLYKTYDASGNFLKAFSNSICAYKYGDGPLDDQSLWGVYRLSSRLPNNIDVNHFGIIKEDTRLTQTTLEGHYRLEVCNP